MANVTLTNQMIARSAAAILAEEAPFIMNLNRGREEEFKKKANGYKSGDNVDIRIPPVGVVYDGVNFVAHDHQETKINLKVDTEKGIGLDFSNNERTLEVSQFEERFIRPQMRVLASTIEADLIAKAMVTVPNLVGTPGTTPANLKVYAAARGKLQQYLAAPSDRCTLMSSAANIELTDEARQLFNTGTQGDKAYLRGLIGEALGADWYEHQSLYVHTNGTQAGFTVNGAAQSGSTLAVDAVTNSNTLTKGTVFTLPGVFAVHPLTGVARSELQQFVITEDVTISGTSANLSIFPAITATGPNKTVSAAPADNAVATISGAADTSYARNLMYQKDAFTSAFVPREKIASADCSNATLPNGISVMVTTFGNGQDLSQATRADVLYGFASVRPLHACAITE